MIERLQHDVHILPPILDPQLSGGEGPVNYQPYAERWRGLLNSDQLEAFACNLMWQRF